MERNKNNNPITSADFVRLQQNSECRARIEIARKIPTHIEYAAPNTAEYELACDIANFLQKDKNDTVRASLAEAIAFSQNSPKHLIIALAHDNSNEVSIPILRHSPILNDNDLQEIIETTEETVRLVAIAERKLVSVTISKLLIKKNISKVTISLLENKGAEIDNSSAKHIAHMNKNNQLIIEKLFAKMPQYVNDLQPILASANNAQQNKEVKTLQSFTAISDELLRNDIKAIHNLGTAPNLQDCNLLAETIYKNGKMTAITLIIALCLGQEKFFKSCIAIHTGLPYSKIDEMCDPKHDKLKLLFTKARISPSLFPLMSWILSNVARQKKRGYNVNSIEFVQAMAKNMHRAELQGINFARTIGMSVIDVIERNIS